MGKQVVGLRIGASRISAARVAVNGAVELRQIAESPLEPGIVEGGEVQDVERLAAALKTFFNEHKLPKRGIRVGVANNRIGIRTIDLEGIDDPRQVANAVRFRAQEALPIPIDEAVLDFQILSDTPGAIGAGPSKRVLLVVAYRELVLTYAKACQQAGLHLLGVDLEAFALLRALSSPIGAEDREQGALIAVSIGSERSVLAVTDGSTCEFARVLEWGGNLLTAAVARALELDSEAAERLKIALGVEAEAVPEGLTIEQAEKAREALGLALQAFGRELVSSLQFYQSQTNSRGIRELQIAGGTAQMAGLAGELRRLVGVPVRVGDPLRSVTVAKKLKGSPNPSHAVPIGLAIGI